MKSIKSKLLVFLGAMIACVCTGLACLAFMYSVNALKSNLGNTMPEIAQQTASYVKSTMNGHLDVLESIASRHDIS